MSLVRAQAPPQSSQSGALVAKLNGFGMKPAAKAELKTDVSVKQKTRKTNVIAAVDVGRTMSIEVARCELKKLWQLLNKGDSLSIITFAQGSKPPLLPAKLQGEGLGRRLALAGTWRALL